MVVVIGSPRRRSGIVTSGRLAGGMAVAIARAAVEAGAQVQVVGKLGDDAAGDELVVELERAGIGHAALLRDPAASTPIGNEDPTAALAPADVELALRYLSDVRVIVVAEPIGSEAGDIVERSAAFTGAHRVVVGDGGGEDVTVLRPDGSDEVAFAALVGRYAARLDGGAAPGDAFQHASAEVGWAPAEG